MNFSLGAVADSDVSLLGAMNEQEFLNAVDNAQPVEKVKLFRRMKGAASTSAGSRKEFEKRIGLLPVDVQKGLGNQSLQITDTFLYVVKALEGSKNIKMFRDDDNKVTGFSNISSAKLEKGNFFLLHGLRIMYGVSDAGVNDPFGVNFDLVPDFIRNGEFEFKANGATIIPVTSCEAFNTKGSNRVVQNTFVLDNPKMLRDQQVFELNLEWGKAAPERSWLKAVLIGSSLVKA
jgi:hypothetical protein